MLFKANQLNRCLYSRISNSSSTGENDKIIENVDAKEVSRVISDSNSILQKKALKLIFATVLLWVMYFYVMKDMSRKLYGTNKL